MGAGILTGVAFLVPQMLTDANNREYNISLLKAWTTMRHLDVAGAVRTLLFMDMKDHQYVGNNGVYWSLLPEALFYLLVPLAFWRIRLYYVASLLFYIIGTAVSAMHYHVNIVAEFLLIYNAYFALGAFLYDLIVHTEWLAWFRKASGWLLASIMFILFVVLIGLALLRLPIFSGIDASVLAVLAVSVLLAGRVSPRNLILRLFHPIGIFSFTLYLCHSPLLLLCASIPTALTGNLVSYARYYWLAVPIVTMLCYVLYWCTERVSINFFRKV